MIKVSLILSNVSASDFSVDFSSQPATEFLSRIVLHNHVDGFGSDHGAALIRAIQARALVVRPCDVTLLCISWPPAASLAAQCTENGE